MQKVHFNRIVIIQSIPEGELHTGTKLHEDIDMLNIAYDRRLDVKLYNIKTKTELLELLFCLTNEASNYGQIPILHIEAHGRDDNRGLVLASDDFISWKDLKDPLIKLNIATRNNLFIVLAACHGANLTETLLPTDRAPCWGLIGPKKQIPAEVLLKSFSAFYKELLWTGSGGKAVKVLNDAVPQGVIGYFFTSAEIFFEQVFRKYLSKSCTKKALDERARNMRKTCKKLGIISYPSINAIKKKHLARASVPFEKYKRLFFMIDLYPENEKRFPIAYSDVRH